MMADAALADRGRRSSPRTRSGATTPSSTCAARSCTCTAGCCRRSRRRTRPGYLGKDILGSGLRPRHHRARRRRRLHLRRGDGAARLARGPPRPAPAEAAVPGGRRPVRPPDRGQQRRVDRQSCRRSVHGGATGSSRWAPRSRPGFGLFSLSGHVQRPGQYEAPLGITLRELLEMAGGIRDGHRAEVLDAGRLVHAAASPPSTSTSRWTSSRSARPARCSAPARCRSSTTRPAWCARRCAGPSSTRTSRAASAPRAARARTGWSRCCTGSRPARAPRPTSTRCWTSATTSSAARSARSATARRQPDHVVDPVLPGRVRAGTATHGGCPFDPVASTALRRRRPRR